MKKLLSMLLALVLVAAFLAGCGNGDSNDGPPVINTPPPTTQTPTENGTGTVDPDNPDEVQARGPIMISAAELSAIVDDPNVFLFGVINPTAALVPFSNAANPLRGSHLVWAPDYQSAGSTEALSSAIPYSRKSQADMENLLSRSGAKADSIFVVYTSDGLAPGGRFAWQLSMLGLDVRFLDGGVAAWRSHGGRTGSSRRLADQNVQGEFRAPNYNPAAFDATIDVVIEALQNPEEWVVIDVRPPSESTDKSANSGAYGTGRMKGGANVEFTQLFDSDNKRISEAELRNMFGFIGDRKVIVY